MQEQERRAALGEVRRPVRWAAMRKAAGYVLIVVSFLAWAVIPLLPWFELSVGQAATAVSGLIIGGEVTFYVGILLLGREAWQRIKALVAAWRSPRR